MYGRATTSVHSRTRDEVEAMIAGLDLVEPGVVRGPQWRPDPEAKPDPGPGRSHVYVAVARKPGPRAAPSPPAPRGHPLG